jgi:hypothetical protein
VDSIFGDIDFALIEYTSLSGRGILYLVEVANDATEHMRKALQRCGAVFISFLLATWGPNSARWWPFSGALNRTAIA